MRAPWAINHLTPFDQAVALLLCVQGCSISAAAKFVNCHEAVIERLCEITQLPRLCADSNPRAILALVFADQHVRYFLYQDYGLERAKKIFPRARAKVRRLMPLIHDFEQLYHDIRLKQAQVSA